jgi:TonB-dependent SusC/RagA subfamily outer membrane receptor
MVGASLLLGGLAAAAPNAHAQQGSIGGVVTDEATGDPLEAARVILVGPNRIEATNREGRYTFRNIAPGSHQIRVLRLGYRPATDSAAVAPGETVALDFALAPAPVQLDEIVTTATGQQSKLEIGNAVSTIEASKVAEEAPITEFGNLLTGRAAGVQVLKSSGATGTGTKIRIRGSNSVSLSNEPLYYVDGVRIDATADGYAYNIGGQSTSRINDLNPDDIENIEIVKGPSAATLYGIQASNGVVLITTKRGAAGKARWNVFVEQGAVEDHNTYRTNFFGRSEDPEWDTFCTLVNVAQGDCVQSQVDAYNPLNDPAQRPLAAGHRHQYGVNVAGGGENATYYVSAEYEGEDGVYKLRGFDFDSVSEATGGDIPDEQLRPNELDKLTLRANGNARLSSTADLQLSLGYLTSQLHLPENDNTLKFDYREWRWSWGAPGHQPGMVPDSGGGLRGAEPAGHRAVHRRPHSQLAPAPLADDEGDVRLRRDQPAGHPVLADGRGQRSGVPDPISGRDQRRSGPDLPGLGGPLQRGLVQGFLGLERPNGGGRAVLPQSHHQQLCPGTRTRARLGVDLRRGHHRRVRRLRREPVRRGVRRPADELAEPTVPHGGPSARRQ